MPFGVPDTRQFPWDEPLSNHLKQLNNPTTGGINTWATNPTVGVDGATLGTNHVGYTGLNTTTSSIVRWNGTAWDGLMDGYKLVLTPQLDVYVNQATGNDSNDGKTASTAWKTISKFYQEINKYNLLSKQVNLYLGAGTYSILFPPTTWGGIIKVIGASSATVTIQTMTVTKSTLVMIQDVTLGHPEVLNLSPFAWTISLQDSTLQIGQNVIMGPLGNYIQGYARFHIHGVNSSVVLIAGLPITISGSVNSVFTLVKGRVLVSTYYNPTAGAVTPNTAPNVDTGASYTYLPSPTSSDTTVRINVIGSIIAESFFKLDDGANVNGPPLWNMAISGSLTGSAYSLTNGSFINGYVAKAASISQGIAYPASVSSGTKDSTSTIMGVPL